MPRILLVIFYLFSVLNANSLKEDFIVKKGLFKYFKVSDCMQLNLSTCYANHPLTPYGLIYLPRSEQEIPYPGCSVECPFCNFLCHPDNGMSPIWRLDKDEAIVVDVGWIPSMKYSTFTMYLWGRYHKDLIFQEDTPYYLQCKNKKSYCPHFASLGDSISIHSPTKVIITPSVTVYTKLFQHFKDPNVKLLVMPGNILNMGVDTPTRDLFSFIHRIAFVDNQTEISEYIENPAINITRLTLNKTLKNNVLFDRVKLKKRKTGKKESSPDFTHEQLVEGLKTLKQAVIKKYNSKFYESEMTAAFFDSGYDCIDNHYQCNGDVRDTLYTVSKSFLKDDYICSIVKNLNIQPLIIIIIMTCAYFCLNIRSYRTLLFILCFMGVLHSLNVYPCAKPSVLRTTTNKNDFFVMIGVNHKQTDYCMYHSISIYKKNKRIGMKVITDDQFFNSSFQYTPELSQYLYTYKFKYDCWGEEYCSQIGTKKVFFIERMYVHPKTGIGAHRSEIINSTLLHFSPY